MSNENVGTIRLSFPMHEWCYSVAEEYGHYNFVVSRTEYSLLLGERACSPGDISGRVQVSFFALASAMAPQRLWIEPQDENNGKSMLICRALSPCCRLKALSNRGVTAVGDMCCDGRKVAKREAF